MALVTRDVDNFLGMLIDIGGGGYSNKTPLFDLCASIGNIGRTNKMSIPMSVGTTLIIGSQDVVTEAVSGAAITPAVYDRAQVYNMMEIYAKTIDVTAIKTATWGERGGINAMGASVPISEVDYQVMETLNEIKRDIEFSMIQGTYVGDGGSAVASQQRGLLEACASSVVAAGNVDLTIALINELITDMTSNGAKFKMPVILAGMREINLINQLYGYALQSNDIGGTNVTTINTVQGPVRIVFEPQTLAGTLLLVDLAYLTPTFLALPKVLGGSQPNASDLNSGLDVAVYDIASGGASIKKQIQTVVGLNYSSELLHGKITGLKTS